MDWQPDEKLEPRISVTMSTENASKVTPNKSALLEQINMDFPIGIGGVVQGTEQLITPVGTEKEMINMDFLNGLAEEQMSPVGTERSPLTITSLFAISGASIHGGGGRQQHSSPRTSTSVPTESNQDDKNSKTNPNERTDNSSSSKHKDDAEAREKREVFENTIRRKLRENNANSSDIESNRELKRKIRKETKKFLNKNFNINTTGK